MLKKHYKGTPEWEAEIKNLVGQVIDKTFNQGEKKPDGTLVSAENGETIKVNEVEHLFKEIKAQKQLAKQKLDQLNTKSASGDELAQVYQELDDLGKILYPPSNGTNTENWKDNQTAYAKRYQDWLETAYNINGKTGWKNIQNEYEARQFYEAIKPDGTADGSRNKDYSNLYTFTTYQDGKQTDWKITEAEVIKLITRTIKELQQIKPTEFDNFISSSDAKLNTLEATKFPNGTFNDGNIKAWFKTVQDLKLKDNYLTGTTNPANGQRVEYSFGHNYTNYGTTNASDAKTFTETELTELFNLVKVLDEKYAEWKDKNDFKTAVANVVDDTLIILPAKAEPVAESQLKEWGITGYSQNSNGKTNYYLTDYGTQLTSTERDLKQTEYSWDTKQALKVADGLSGWIKLLHTIFRQGESGLHSSYLNYRKLLSSFEADPVNQLFADIRTTDKYGRFGPANAYTLNEFPRTLALAEKKYYALKTKKKRLLSHSQNQAEIEKLETEYNAAKTELAHKETELDNKIQAKITEIRTNLKKDYPNRGLGIGETYHGFQKTADKDNRIEITDIGKIIFQIQNIKYLESGDTDANSSNPNEDKALVEINQLRKDIDPIGDNLTEAQKKISYVNTFMIMGDTDAKRIEKIKDLIEKPWQCFTWQELHDGFDELEKLIKIPPHYQDSQQALKTHIEIPDNPTEKLTDWQIKLKTLDPLITATVFTEAKMKDFQQHNNFKKVDGILSLLKKVMEPESDGTTYQVKKNFVDDYLVKEVAEVNNLGKMMTQWEAEKIIKLIALFDYEQNQTETDQKKIRRVYSWDRQKKVDDKYVASDGDYEITAEEKKLEGDFTKFLYELSTGAKSLNSISQPVEEQSTPTNNQTPPQKPFWKSPLGITLWITLGLIAIGAIATIIYWNRLKSWWNSNDTALDGV